MLRPTLAAALVLAASALAADAPLPVLRTEPTAGGSTFFVKNTGTQPLTAYLIELVDYPGSSFTLWQDEFIAGEPISPGAERRIPVTNMTVGAVPDYVKLRAALFADGASAGDPTRTAQFIERRRAILATTRELIRRLESPTPDLKSWLDTLASAPKPKRDSQDSINQPAIRALISTAGKTPAPEALAHLRALERTLSTSKPPL